MDQFTPEQIQEKYDQLTPEMKQIVSSPEILKTIQDIGNKHNLMIDQIGDLVRGVCLVMIGLAKSSNFANDISARLGIDEGTAKDITISINSSVFEEIKNEMHPAQKQEMGSNSLQSSISSIEKAGDFEIVDHNAPITESTKGPEGDTSHAEVEAIADQLLTSPTPIAPVTPSAPVQPTAPTAPIAPHTPPTPPKASGEDPYKEIL